jgi:CelD/BcsL family acetyltransferase involved in cellulose biosynthesis
MQTDNKEIPMAPTRAPATSGEGAPAQPKGPGQRNAEAKETAGGSPAVNRHVPVTYKKVSRCDVGKSQWDDFAAKSPTAWFWHRYDYAEIWGAWPGRQDVSFALVDPTTTEVVATVPTVKIFDRLGRFFTWNSLDVFAGVAYSPLLPKKVRAAVLESVTKELEAMAREHEAHEIRFSLAVMTPEIRGADCPRINPLLELGCANTIEQAWVCDLRNSKDDLWKKIGKGAKSSISKAQKNGVHIRMATERDLDRYYQLHCETYHRTGTPAFPREFFEGIWKHFLTSGLSAIFVAEHEGEVIAAANMAVYKKGAHYWTGASNEKALSLGANALLQWAAIQWMADEKVEWYEVGPAYPYAKGGKHKQISDFKKDFGGSLYPYFRGALDTKNKFRKTLALLKEFHKQVLR